MLKPTAFGFAPVNIRTLTTARLPAGDCIIVRDKLNAFRCGMRKKSLTGIPAVTANDKPLGKDFRSFQNFGSLVLGYPKISLISSTESDFTKLSSVVINA